MFGFSVGGLISDHYGKKRTVFVFNLLTSTCWIICAKATTKCLLFISFSLQGFFGAIAYNCVGKMEKMLYLWHFENCDCHYKCLELKINNLDRVICQFTGIFIAEISHASARRILGSFQNIAVSFGCLLSYTTTAFAPWRMCKLIFSVVVILPAAFAILLFEETPHWLVKNGRIDEARYVGRFLSISKEQ